MLRRLNAVPDRYMLSPNYSEHINNGSAFSELTGRDDFTLGSLRLDSLEVKRQTSCDIGRCCASAMELGRTMGLHERAPRIKAFVFLIPNIFEGFPVDPPIRLRVHRWCALITLRISRMDIPTTFPQPPTRHVCHAHR